MDSTRVYLARHGQVVGHADFRYNGHTDVDITSVGISQMQRLAEFFADKGIAALYSSDLQRAYKGAEIIGERLGIKASRIHVFRELHLGRWEGMTRDEAAQKFPDEAHFSFKDLANNKLKGGESLVELKARVLPALHELIAKYRGKSIGIVAHGGVNRVVLCDAMGLPVERFFNIEQDYGGLNLIDYFGDGHAVVKMLNGGPNQEMEKTKIY
ncbi:MAG: histidine phosphatase family protein [Deltaproteobacteria bacterium]|nr:histidine phosphatase family protein [Deltaproteobacteria bacterium]